MNSNIAEDILRNQKLRDIQLKDSDVLSNMRDIKSVPTQELVRISKELDKPFCSDKPGKLTLNTEGGIYSDYLEDFRNNYNNDIIEDEEEIIGEIFIGDAVKRTVDIEVKRAVKALLITGQCFDPELGLAVDSLFSQFMEYIIQNKHTTIRQFIELFKVKNAYEKNLLKTMKEILKYEERTE